MSYPFTRVTKSQSGGPIYPPANECIYCGSTKGLSKEHVIPYGLFGELLLLKASCQTCQQITSKLEAFVLQKMLGGHRKKFNFQSYTKPKNRKPPKEIIERINADGSRTPIEIGQSQMPFHTWAMPIFGVPGITWLMPLSKVKEKDRIHCLVSEHDALTALDVVGPGRPARLPPIEYHPDLFMRFLAKIAHSYACGALGMSSFQPLLKDYIINGTEDGRIFVGGEVEIEPPVPELYRVLFGTLDRSDGVQFLAVKIRLLSYMGTPTYTVVVGQGFKDDLAALKDSGYAKTVKISVVGTDGVPVFTSGL